MYTCIITGGPDISPDAALIAMSCDRVLCADGGADFAFANNMLDKVSRIYGDLDSISEEAKKKAQELNIEIVKFPIEKDMTDTEIILSEVDPLDEIILVTSMGGRMDHFLSNVNMLVKYKREGYRISATDGVTDIIPFCGRETIELELPDGFEDLNVSVIPYEEVKGASFKGLYYKLENADLKFGDTFSVSNHPVEKDISFSFEGGSGVIVICP